MATRGVLWDMDGVLVDTGEFHFQAWEGLLPEYGLPFNRELFNATFGMNNYGIVKALLGREPDPRLVDEIAARKEERLRRFVQGHVTLLPGAADWLNRLKAGGWRQAVASSSPLENIHAILGSLRLDAFFDALVSGADLPGKPEPALFLSGAHALTVSPKRCVVVEDAIAGVEAAKRGGMKCIAVLTTNPAETLSKADVIVERLHLLPSDAFDRLVP
jgi:HAD superfamily hydrolase (TIGR01509 family)